MSDEKIIKLKEKIDSILSSLETNVSKTKSKTNRKSGGIKRGIKGSTVRKIYSLIINHAIEETKSKYKLVMYKDLPKEIKKFNILKVPKKYEDKYNLNFSDEEKSKGYECQYDGYIVFENKLVMLVEYKAYFENAMIKRCLMDATFAQLVDKKIIYCLCALETQVLQDGREIGYNSHSLRNFFYEKFKTEIEVLFLLDEARIIGRDITEKENVKEVNIDKLKKAVNYFIDFVK